MYVLDLPQRKFLDRGGHDMIILISIGQKRGILDKVEITIFLTQI